MKYPATILTLIAIMSLLAFVGCRSDEAKSGEHGNGSGSGEHGDGSESGEHGGVSGEHGNGSGSGEHGDGSESGESGEESGAQFALDEPFNDVRGGARLILSYDSTANAFIGTVENTTNAALPQVRVEVHLSNGIELGPTAPVDLAPGQVVSVTLPAPSQPFVSWSAHPEVG